MKRLLKKKRKLQSTEMNLQITSMADIFTILLVFLLKSYAVGALEVQPSRGLELPVASRTDVAEQRIALEVSENSVQLDGQPVLPLKNFELEGATRVEPLGKALGEKRAALGDDSKGKLLLVADARVPFETLETVMKTAANQGFSDLKLAVVQP
jgi:biopolymer transport protein ExbD